jgi:7-keto-8-aminopelargonate synthetase-like enzyme
VLFPTGFAANLGVLTCFGGPDVLVVSDELNHASIIDGCRLARAECAVARHADPEHVDALLGGAGARRGLVVTDTVFSMDGDVAPVAELLDVCARRGALLVLDEAHAVLGPDAGVDDGVDDDGADVIRIGTLSKTLGSLGGFAAGRAAYADLVVNRARSYIFTTASTPADSAAALAALEILRSREGDELRSRLRAHVERVRPGHPSPIVPVVLGDERATLAASDALLEQGMLVPAIRPPTVPVGTSRLRVALSAAHTSEQVDALVDALAAFAPR